MSLWLEHFPSDFSNLGVAETNPHTQQKKGIDRQEPICLWYATLGPGGSRLDGSTL
jgi:hypothetical protein